MEGRWRICSIYDKKIQITQTVCLTTKLWATLETKVREESAIQNSLTNKRQRESGREKSLHKRLINDHKSNHITNKHTIMVSRQYYYLYKDHFEILSQLHFIFFNVSNWTFANEFFTIKSYLLIMMTTLITLIPHP